jgi:hypothetical protein
MERNRSVHQIIKCRWDNGLLFCLWSDGRRRIVTTPNQRASLVRQMHEELDHFCIRKIHSILHAEYWWNGMCQQLAAYVETYEVRDRVTSSLTPCHLNYNPYLSWDWTIVGR